MYASSDAPQRARWQVMWVKGGRVVKHDFGADLAEATRVYGLAVKGQRRAATLRCCNMGFPPPEKYADREVVVVRRAGRRVKGKRLKQPLQYRERMNTLNRRGFWWCPYCMQLRRFVKRSRLRVEGVTMDMPGMHCPMCNISHRDGNVQRYNPIAAMISARVQDPNRKRRRRSRHTEEEDE